MFLEKPKSFFPFSSSAGFFILNGFFQRECNQILRAVKTKKM